MFQDIPAEKLDEFLPRLLQHFRETQGALCSVIQQSGQLSDEQQSLIIECAKEFVQETFGA